MHISPSYLFIAFLAAASSSSTSRVAAAPWRLQHGHGHEHGHGHHGRPAGSWRTGSEVLEEFVVISPFVPSHAACSSSSSVVPSSHAPSSHPPSSAPSIAIASQTLPSTLSSIVKPSSFSPLEQTSSSSSSRPSPTPSSLSPSLSSPPSSTPAVAVTKSTPHPNPPKKTCPANAPRHCCESIQELTHSVTDSLSDLLPVLGDIDVKSIIGISCTCCVVKCMFVSLISSDLLFFPQAHPCQRAGRIRSVSTRCYVVVLSLWYVLSIHENPWTILSAFFSPIPSDVQDRLSFN
ncbi:hypothetical protein VTN96DRAFT_44 [Rasamsonia emersonii]